MAKLTYGDLNQGQQQAVEGLQDWYHNSDSPVILLEGRAGRGKTTVGNVFSAITKLTTLLTATTNNAASLLGAEAKTYHSAFNLRVMHHKAGSYLTQYSSPHFDGIDVIWVDEGSMLTSEGLEYMLASNMRFIIAGDRIQLPPIEDNETTKRPREYSVVYEKGYPSLKLTEPMRNFGELFEYTEALADGIESGRYVSEPPKGYGEAVVKYKTTEFRKSLQGDVLDNLSQGNSVVACFRWKTVNALNKVIRSRLHGYSSAPYIIGDSLIILQPYIEYPDPTNPLEKNIICNSNTTGVVLSVRKSFSPIEPFISCWEIELDSTAGNISIYVPTSDGAVTRKKLAHDRKLEALSLADSYDKAAINKAWENYHMLFSGHADVNYAFARTIHRLQGCTIPVVYNQMTDILLHYDEIAYRRLYVAAGRASERVYNIV